MMCINDVFRYFALSSVIAAALHISTLLVFASLTASLHALLCTGLNVIVVLSVIMDKISAIIPVCSCIPLVHSKGGQSGS
jgi:hypothetical protein